jgi:hypothetical protein
MDWEERCALQDGPPYICRLCGRAIDGTDEAEIEAHHIEHQHEEWRAQCPIPIRPLAPSRAPLMDDAEDVPF